MKIMKSRLPYIVADLVFIVACVVGPADKIPRLWHLLRCSSIHNTYHSVIFSVSILNSGLPVAIGTHSPLLLLPYSSRTRVQFPCGPHSRALRQAEQSRDLSNGNAWWCGAKAESDTWRDSQSSFLLVISFFFFFFVIATEDQEADRHSLALGSNTP